MGVARVAVLGKDWPEGLAEAFRAQDLEPQPVADTGALEAALHDGAVAAVLLEGAATQPAVTRWARERSSRRAGVPILTAPRQETARELATEVCRALRASAGSGTVAASEPGIAAIVGESPAARRLRADVAKIAASEATTILLQGESGTGKDLVARLLHSSSGRHQRPFLPVNCSAIPEQLLEDEFFGHEPGAFTDARQRKSGLFEVADGGTVFLDEVAELGLGLQAKLLRFLEDRQVRRLGSARPVPVDVRIIAATNVDLAGAVRHQKFRPDLYYRLRVVPLTLPPLRERVEDVPALAGHFLQQFTLRFRKRFRGFSPAALRRLQSHRWPGNIRELRNAVERAVLLEEGDEISADMLWLGDSLAPLADQSGATAAADGDLNIARIELRALVQALERAGGNQSRAALLLGVSRDTVRYRMSKFGVKVETRVTVQRPDGRPPRS